MVAYILGCPELSEASCHTLSLAYQPISGWTLNPASSKGRDSPVQRLCTQVHLDMPSETDSAVGPIFGSKDGILQDRPCEDDDATAKISLIAHHLGLPAPGNVRLCDVRLPARHILTRAWLFYLIEVCEKLALAAAAQCQVEILPRLLQTAMLMQRMANIMHP